MYGLGLFETVRVCRGTAVFFEDHFSRMRKSAAALGLEMKKSMAELLESSRKVISENGLDEGSLKLVLYQAEGFTSVAILARRGLYSPEVFARGFRLKIEEVKQRSSLAAHKTLNYFESITAKRRALAAGYDEPLFVDTEEQVLEGATTNVFIVHLGQVITPPADGRILPGVVRARILNLLGPRGVQQPVAIDQLLAATEVFVTNALLGVMPVSSIDHVKFDITHNPVSREIADALNRSLSSIK
ncbi:MAG: aminotransferase class IV [Nibricoccus sp.]